ncbi:MAG: DUF1343 domain-containing protein [Fimbriimonadaceae bacterium]|nr:DUF1343 domain-containing protein [Fimbriimonadaceae bacterium]
MLPLMVATVVAAPVLNGIDVLERDGFALLKGRSVGLITNHTGRTLDGRSTADVLANAPGVRLVAFFAPEHGIRGEKDERISDGKDEKTGLPVYSLYNPGAKAYRYRPTPEQLRGIDTLVFDIQDVGARFYTYIGTMGYAMEEAAKNKVRMVVLDRPNPITGLDPEGPIADPDRLGLTAYHELPVRHGMTVGELARLFNVERKIGCDLQVVNVEGWNRSQWFDELGQTWVNPSPNMRSPVQALLYPGVCLLEATNVSVGRGTDTPFEWIGAPWMDGRALADAMNAKGLAGVRFYARAMTPNASKHKDEVCGGVGIIVTDRRRLEPVRMGAELAHEMARLFPKWDAKALVNLMHNAEAARRVVEQGYEAAAAVWKPALRRFESVRRKYLLYR